MASHWLPSTASGATVPAAPQAPLIRARRHPALGTPITDLGAIVQPPLELCMSSLLRRRLTSLWRRPGNLAFRISISCVWQHRVNAQSPPMSPCDFLRWRLPSPPLPNAPVALEEALEPCFSFQLHPSPKRSPLLWCLRTLPRGFPRTPYSPRLDRLQLAGSNQWAALPDVLDVLGCWGESSLGQPASDDPLASVNQYDIVVQVHCFLGQLPSQAPLLATAAALCNGHPRVAATDGKGREEW